MIVRGSREIVIDAAPETVMEVLADVGGLASWSAVHKQTEVVDTHPDGRPHHVKVTVKIMGITEKESLEYHWGPLWMVWDAGATMQQRGQHGEYNLTPELGKTRVRFGLTMELRAPVPEFLVRRGKKIVLDVATEGLRERVMNRAKGEPG